MSTETDLSALTVGELVQTFVDTIQFRKTITHVGRRNRLIDQIGRISDALESRDPALKSLRDLLDHPDRELRYFAACNFRKIDQAAYKQIISALAEGDDDIAFEAGFILRHDADDDKEGDGGPNAQSDAPSTPEAALTDDEFVSRF